jgi:hypothetical protein
MDFLLALQLATAAIGSQGALPDSTALGREARLAQQRFESIRRSNLPFGRENGSRACEARIGRFCYWQDPADVHRQEPPKVSAARETLIASLNRAAAALPSDGWVQGQRVRYLMEAERVGEAMLAADECGAEPWWCASLRGLAEHIAGSYADANASFDRAMAAAPQDVRCGWRDISALLEDPHRSRQSSIVCEARGATEERFWTLSQPMYLLGTNDLRSEHFARQVMSRLEAQARGAYDVGWGGDVHELIVRYGWPTSWSRARESQLAGPAFARIIGHEPVPNWQFAVNGRALAASLADARGEDWELGPMTANSRYAAPYARSFTYLPHQLARFARGDSLVIVAAMELPGPPRMGERVQAALALVTGDSGPVVHVAYPMGSLAVVTATSTNSPQLASVELLDRESKLARRARYGVAPLRRGGRTGLSDLLLHIPADSQPRTLGEATRLAIGTTTIAAAALPRIGVYWESYGLKPGGEPAVVLLSMERTDLRWVERAASRLRLVRSSARPLHVRWQDVPGQDGGFNGRSLTIDVSAVRAGRYLLSVTLSTADGGSAFAERLVEIER